MSGIVYGLCTIMALFCALLLLRGYWRNKHQLLLWSGICFVGLCLNNLFLVIDSLSGPNLDLSVIRLIPALIGILLLVYGLICEEK